jgi:hypothetical protein
MLFIISGHDRQNGMAARLEQRTAHRAHYSELGDDLILAGPYLDDKGEPVGSMIVMRMPDEAAARAHMEADPYVINKVFASVELARWDWFMKRPEGFES